MTAKGRGLCQFSYNGLYINATVSHKPSVLQDQNGFFKRRQTIRLISGSVIDARVNSQEIDMYPY